MKRNYLLDLIDGKNTWSNPAYWVWLIFVGFTLYFATHGHAGLATVASFVWGFIVGTNFQTLVMGKE
jgi:hypothetical protein